MDPKYQVFFFLVALVCFVVSAVWNMEKKQPHDLLSVNMLSLGLAFFDFVFLWNAYKAI